MNTRHIHRSLLPALMQGVTGHEAAKTNCCYMRINRVSHTVDIHLFDPKFAL